MKPVNSDRIVKIGLALAFAGAAGFYLERGVQVPGTTAITAAGDGEVLRVLREPRPLPDIRFTDGDGRAVRLSDYRGKVILLNIWATWCAPCRKEMPALDRLQSSLGGPDFEVVALSIDRAGLPAITAFYRQSGLRQLRIWVDESGQALPDLGVAGIPTTLLIDRRGNELGRKTGAAEWDSPALVKVIREHLDVTATSPAN